MTHKHRVLKMHFFFQSNGPMISDKYKTVKIDDIQGARVFDEMGDKRVRGGSIEGAAFKVNAQPSH